MAVRDSKALQIELRYLSDPVKLADHVHYTLRCEKPDKALDLCRLASKKQEVIVSWNHCVDWYMARGRVNEALRIYNEMKKRAQFPDAYTYTLLLRGLAKASHPDQPVREENVVRALSIYNSLSSPTSRVKPSIYHTNAVLTVCSAALDTDSLWSILSQLPSTGTRAADHMTYAIILNALRHGAFGRNPDDVNAEQVARRRQKAVQEGRAVWREVIRRWRAGEVRMDEELVCAMGRLLLFSKSMRDWDDVLSLVEQTMSIDRRVPEIGSPDRHVEHVPQDGTDLRVAEAEPEEDSEGYTDTPAAKAFKTIRPLPLDSSHPHRPTVLVHAQPGNPTLSMLIGACTVLRTPKTATAYWDILTSPTYGIRPDIRNIHAQLRLLGMNRASAQAIRLIKEALPSAGLVPTHHTFRMLMSVCGRDKNNPNVLAHAREVVDMMEATASDPDSHVLMQYLSLALTTDDGAKITATLDRLDPIVHNLRSRVLYGPDTPQKIGGERDVADKQAAVQFLQMMVGVIDTLMQRGLVDRDDFGHWHARRSQLTQFIGRAKDRIERQIGGMDIRTIGRGKDGEVMIGKEVNMKEPHWQRRRAEWEVRNFRGKDRAREKAERERLNAIGVSKWHEKQAEAKGERFADSPMELGMEGGGTEGPRIRYHGTGVPGE